MTEDRLRRDFKLNLFLFSSLSSLIAKDVLAACEITAAQSSSLDCANGKMKMVNPDSIVNRTCSILNDTTTPGTTWRGVNNTLKPKAGLVLKSGNSITRIYLRLAVHLIFSTTSVRTLYPGLTLKLRCHVSGTPIPSVVWFKDGKLITNSAEGFYHTEKLSEFEPDTLEATVHVPGREENEGFYNCTAKNSICGLSSKTSTEIQVQYNCPPPKEIQPADSSDIHSTVSSNITLTCLVRMSEEILKHCNFTWYFNNTKLQVQTDDKYKTELKANHSKCRKEFSLTVTNVTLYDEGEYSCHQICYYGRSKANISLHVYQKQDTSPTSGNKITSAHPTTTNQGGRKRKWIIPIISASTCGVFLLITAVLIRFMKKKWAYKKMKCCAEDGVTSNKLFISYSSKDVSWVTENLIFLLEKHSIPYSIHTRDFELGKPIVQNMADSVYNSRQVLIVLSDNYLASNFCREELHMAIQRGVDTGDSSVVLVLIDNFNKKRLPCALGNKVLLDFKKHKKQQDWEEKLLKVVLGAKTFSL